MFKMIESGVSSMTSSASMILRWCADHPKITMILLLYYGSNAVLAAEGNRLVWDFDCGAVEMHNVDEGVNIPQGLFYSKGNPCIQPFLHLGKNMVACLIGDHDMFARLQELNDVFTVDNRGNPNVSICTQFEKYGYGGSFTR